MQMQCKAGRLIIVASLKTRFLSFSVTKKKKYLSHNID